MLFAKSAVSVRNRVAVAISLAFMQSEMLLLWTQVLTLFHVCAVLYVAFNFFEGLYFGTCVYGEALRWLLGTQELLKGLNK